MDNRSLVFTLAELLAARTDWVWRPDGPVYTDAEVGIHYGPIAESPDRGVGITVYSATDDVATGLAVRRVQFMFRGPAGDPSGADTLGDEAFAALQGITHTDGITLIRRESTAPLGVDDTGRASRSDNYSLILSRTTTY